MAFQYGKMTAADPSAITISAWVYGPHNNRPVFHFGPQPAIFVVTSGIYAALGVVAMTIYGPNAAGPTHDLPLNPGWNNFPFMQTVNNGTDPRNLIGGQITFTTHICIYTTADATGGSNPRAIAPFHLVYDCTKVTFKLARDKITGAQGSPAAKAYDSETVKPDHCLQQIYTGAPYPYSQFLTMGHAQQFQNLIVMQNSDHSNPYQGSALFIGNYGEVFFNAIPKQEDAWKKTGVAAWGQNYMFGTPPYISPFYGSWDRRATALMGTGDTKVQLSTPNPLLPSGFSRQVIQPKKWNHILFSWQGPKVTTSSWGLVVNGVDRADHVAYDGNIAFNPLNYAIPGAEGLTVSVRGSVSNSSNLPMGLGTSDAGASYMARDTGNLYVWNGQGWNNVGSPSKYPGGMAVNKFNAGIPTCPDRLGIEGDVEEARYAYFYCWFDKYINPADWKNLAMFMTITRNPSSPSKFKGRPAPVDNKTGLNTQMMKMLGTPNLEFKGGVKAFPTNLGTAGSFEVVGTETDVPGPSIDIPDDDPDNIIKPPDI